MIPRSSHFSFINQSLGNDGTPSLLTPKPPFSSVPATQIQTHQDASSTTNKLIVVPTNTIKKKKSSTLIRPGYAHDEEFDSNKKTLDSKEPPLELTSHLDATTSLTPLGAEPSSVISPSSEHNLDLPSTIVPSYDEEQPVFKPETHYPIENSFSSDDLHVDVEPSLDDRTISAFDHHQSTEVEHESSDLDQELDRLFNKNERDRKESLRLWQALVSQEASFPSLSLVLVELKNRLEDDKELEEEERSISSLSLDGTVSRVEEVSQEQEELFTHFTHQLLETTSSLSTSLSHLTTLEDQKLEKQKEEEEIQHKKTVETLHQMSLETTAAHKDWRRAELEVTIEKGEMERLLFLQHHNSLPFTKQIQLYSSHALSLSEEIEELEEQLRKKREEKDKLEEKIEQAKRKEEESQREYSSLLFSSKSRLSLASQAASAAHHYYVELEEKQKESKEKAEKEEERKIQELEKKNSRVDVGFKKQIEKTARLSHFFNQIRAPYSLLLHLRRIQARLFLQFKEEEEALRTEKNELRTTERRLELEEGSLTASGESCNRVLSGLLNKKKVALNERKFGEAAELEKDIVKVKSTQEEVRRSSQRVKALSCATGARLQSLSARRSDVSTRLRSARLFFDRKAVQLLHQLLQLIEPVVQMLAEQEMFEEAEIAQEQQKLWLQDYEKITEGLELTPNDLAPTEPGNLFELEAILFAKPNNENLSPSDRFSSFVTPSQDRLQQTILMLEDELAAVSRGQDEDTAGIIRQKLKELTEVLTANKKPSSD